MLHNQMIRVVGGYRDEKGDFVHTKTVVLREKELGSFFRRDDEFRSMPVIYLKSA